MAHRLDTDLTRLRDAAQRIGQNLVDLELDSGRKLLESSPLVGESASRWSAASAALTQLWQWHALLDDFINRAGQLRDGRHFDQLARELRGQSIELSTTEVPIERRELLGSPEITLRCTPDDLLARMSKAFDEARTVIAVIGRAWETLIPRLDAAGRELVACTRLADELGGGDPADLEIAGRRLTLLRKALSEDPLSVDAADVDRMEHALQTLRHDLDARAVLRRELAGRITAAHGLLENIRGVIEQARAAHEELLIKISVPAAPGAPPMPERLGDQLREIQGLADRGEWSGAAHRLDGLTAQAQSVLDQARRTLEANRAPIEARNQFRALLDAYQVKAKHLGRVEDPELAEIYTLARDALYNAPTDLSLVGQLVRGYQDVLGGHKREASG